MANKIVQPVLGRPKEELEFVRGERNLKQYVQGKGAISKRESEGEKH
jgi:hypothetical protein